MPIAEIPKQVTSNAQDAVQSLTDWAGNLHAEDHHWMRVLGAASLFSGAMLLIGGKRKAALALSTVGTMLVMLEEPKSLANVWATLPSYLQAGERFIDRLEGFAEQVSTQGQRVRGLVERVQR